MTTGGNANAAGLQARHEDQQLTEIAQITPGDTSKILEFINNPAISPALLDVFESAADSAYYAKTLETFNQQQQKIIVQQEQEHEKKEKEQREKDWLNGMSAEYKEAYHQYMDTAEHAKKEYKSGIEELNQDIEKDEKKLKFIDDNAIRLSGNRRAYLNNRGQAVDANGNPLDGQDLVDANKFLQEHGGRASSYEKNEETKADEQKTKELIVQGQNAVTGIDRREESIKRGDVRDARQIQKDNEEIDRNLKSWRNDYSDHLDPHKDSKPSDLINSRSQNSPAQPAVRITNQEIKKDQSAMPDLDNGWATQPSSSTDDTGHSSYASKVDGNPINVPSLTPTFARNSSGSGNLPDQAIDAANTQRQKPTVPGSALS